MEGVEKDGGKEEKEEIKNTRDVETEKGNVRWLDESAEGRKEGTGSKKLQPPRECPSPSRTPSDKGYSPSP